MKISSIEDLRRIKEEAQKELYCEKERLIIEW